MKITMLGSLGNINRLVIPSLIQAGHQVTVVSSNATRADAIKQLGATPAIGDMTDVNFLTQALTGATVAYLMISGTSDDLFASAKQMAAVFSQAVQNANVSHVVNLSSVGAQDPTSGSLYAYHLIEDALNALAVDVAIVRPVGFYNNLFANSATIRKQHAIFSNLPAETMRKMVAPKDIASVVLALLLNPPAGKTIRYVVSDTFSGDELVAALSQALGFNVAYQKISDDQYAANLRQAGVPKSIVTPFVQSTKWQQQPALAYADLAHHPVVSGTVSLTDFAQTFAAALNRGGTDSQAHTVVSR